jgi:RNA polymerase-binding transcription factor
MARSDAGDRDSGAADVGARLAQDRAETLVLIARLSATVGEIIDAATYVAVDDEHDPEGQTLAFERAQASALLHEARTRLAEIDAAGDRLQAGTYGFCEQCGQAIVAERLEVRPTARTCVGCASKR